MNDNKRALKAAKSLGFDKVRVAGGKLPKRRARKNVKRPGPRLILARIPFFRAHVDMCANTLYN